MAKLGVFKYGTKKYGLSIINLINLFARFDINRSLVGSIDTISLKGGLVMAEVDQDFTMYSGDTIMLQFNVTMTGSLTGATIKWVLGKGNTIYVTKTSSDGIVISGEKSFIVTLNPDDTKELKGKYIHEVEVTDAFGNVSTVATGRVTILKDIAI